MNIYTNQINFDLIDKFACSQPELVIDHSSYPLRIKRNVTNPPLCSTVEPEFKKSVEDVAVTKIKELYKNREKYLKELNNISPINDLHEKVLAYSLQEYEKIFKKWLKYWLRLSGYEPEIKNFDNHLVQKAREYPVQDLLTNAKRCGNKFRDSCPFHEEHNASFYVYPDNSWHCFGCQIHGNNAIDFMQKLNPDLPFMDVVKKLQI